MNLPQAEPKERELPFNRNLLLLVCALALGGAAAYLAKSYINTEIEQQKASLDAKKKMVDVVVPKRDLPRGARVTSQDLAVRPVPAEYVHANAVTNANYQVAEGQRLSYDAEQGKPLLWAHLESGKIPTFSGRVPDGMRALTFPVDQINSISGFLQPGDKVDLLLTYKPVKDEITAPLLEQVLVLATGSRTVIDKTLDGKEVQRNYNTVTVQVSPDDAQRIVLAQETGKLTAVLRHPEDLNAMNKRPMTVARLLGEVADKPVPKKSVVPAAVAPVVEKKKEIQFIIGGI